jgi:hypothetical protein
MAARDFRSPRANTTARKALQVKRILVAASILLLVSVVAILVFWERPIAADISPSPQKGS